MYHGEGHSSWVSRVAFDPWARLPPILGTTPAATATAATEPASTSNGGFGGSSGLAPATAVPQRQVQRLASVGQDGCLCLWDVQLPPEADLLPFEIPGPGGRLRKIRSVGSALELAAQAGNGDSSAGGGSGGGLRRPPGGSGAGLEAVTPCPPHALMNIVQPVQRCRIHLEPLSDLLFTEQCVFTADQTANTKCWARPVPPAAVGPGSQSSQMMEDDGGDFGQQGTQTAMMSQ